MSVGEEFGKSKFVLVQLSEWSPLKEGKPSKHKWKLESVFQLSYLLDAMSVKNIRNLD